MKRTIKELGKFFIALNQEGERVISQSMLIVDNGYSWFGYLTSALEKIKQGFPQAELSVLTFPERGNNLKKAFPDLKIIFPNQKLRPKSYQLALQMLKLRKNNYNFVTLFSLDISPMLVGLVFFRSQLLLYNQWEQWWCLKIKRIAQLFKNSYVTKRAKFSLKKFIKKIGLLFVLVERKDEQVFKHKILLVDNGCAAFEHAVFAIAKIKKLLPFANTSILALESRKELFQKDFSELEIIPANNFFIKRYQIASGMFSLRRNKYDYIIFLSLDVSPIITAILLLKGRLILYNKWHQWWTLKAKSPLGYFMIIPQFILTVIVFIYLSIRVFWIFFKRSFN